MASPFLDPQRNSMMSTRNLRQSIAESEDERASPRVRELQGGASGTRLSGFWSVNSANRSSTHSAMLEAALESIHPAQTTRSQNLSLLSPDIKDLGFEYPNIKEAALTPAAQGNKVQCRIIRKKEPGIGLVYELYKEEGQFGSTFMLSACRKRRGKGAYYVISGSRVPTSEQQCLGKLKSNFLGTSFTIYDSGISPTKYKRNNRILPNLKSKGQNEIKLRQELGSVFYEPNLLGFKGPRKMTVLLMGMSSDGTRPEFRPSSETETLVGKYKEGQDPRLLVLKNKPPQWNEDSQSYVLNFSGRVTMASVKNFQIVHANDLDYIVLQFGRVADNTFTMDFQYPLCPLQAFAIALSSFDAKLACE